MTRLSISLLALVAAASVAAAPATSHADDTATLHVATNGSDANPGTADAPLATISRAASLVKPGTTVLIHTGNYHGQVKLGISGTPTARITYKAAGDGPVTVNSTQAPANCNSSQPASQRTFMIGGDYITIDGLNINNGITMAGPRQNSAYVWHANLVKQRNWEPRRAIAGRGSNDPALSRAKLINDLRAVTGDPKIDPVQGVQISNNTMTTRGIQGFLAQYGLIQGNTIRDIECGVGPAIWMMTFSDGNNIRNNDISGVETSGHSHYMQEGIRLGTASNYNLIQANNVHDLGEGDSRAITTDVDSSFNRILNNTASNVATGFSEQMSGWGNIWRLNYAANYRQFAFMIRLMDAKYPTPEWSSASRGGTWACNVAGPPSTSGGKSLGIGGIAHGAFSRNYFPTVYLAPTVRSYWAAEGNTWNWSSTPPEKVTSTDGACTR